MGGECRRGAAVPGRAPPTRPGCHIRIPGRGVAGAGDLYLAVRAGNQEPPSRGNRGILEPGAGFKGTVDMAKGIIGDADVAAFNADGFVLVRGMLDDEETALLGRAAREDRVLDEHSFGRADGEGGTVRLSLWNHPTETIYGMIARCESIVGSMEQLLGGEVYHYHSKMIMKDPLVGGAWAWHQDYGYWYHNGVLNPWMGSAY